MSYQPPHKRNNANGSTNGFTNGLNKDKKKEDYPALVISKNEPNGSKNDPLVKPLVEPGSKMNFAALFKRAIQKKKVKKLKWGTVLLTKNGRIDSMTEEERMAEEESRNKEVHEQRIWNLCCRLEKQQNLRREFDPHYESPEEFSESESEPESEEEEEVLTDDYEEDEFEPDI